MSAELEVFQARRAVGHLVRGLQGEWTFVYADDGKTAPLPNPVSVALPRGRAVHRGPAVQAVFTNLLPDGALRARVARSLGLSVGNDFALLGHLGGETVGALSLREPGQSPAATATALTDTADTERLLDNDELRNLIAVLPVHPLMADTEGWHRSVPGEFDKLPVRLVGNKQVAIAAPDHLTTHIIKPAKPGLRETVSNEAFCMALATAFGLQTAPTVLLPGKISLLAVTRLDRIDGEAGVEARHLEDFCQVLGYLPEQKYEREGGPRLADIAATLKAVSTQPALDLRALLRWAIFSVLVGFGAAHAKQLMLRHGEKGPSLAPFFGIWSTHVYAEMNYRMGFSVGQEDRPDWLTVERWHEFADELGVRPKYVVEVLREAAITLPSLARATVERYRRQYGHADILAPIQTLIAQRARQVLVSIEASSSHLVSSQTRAARLGVAPQLAHNQGTLTAGE